MAVSMESFAELFDANFASIKDEMYNMLPREADQYMRMETMTKAFHKETYVGQLGVPRKNEDYQDIPIDTFSKGFPSVFVPVTYRLGYIIDKKSIEDEQWGILASRPQSLLRGTILIKDLVCSDILNNGTSSMSYDVGGTPLFSTTQAREDGQATWSNRIASDQPITVETLFNAIASLLELMEDSRGFPINYQGTINLYVPKINAELWEQATSVVKSTFNPDTANNRINAVISEFNIQVKPLRFLTNPNHWFLGWDINSPGYGLVCYDRVAPEISQLKPFSDNDDVFHAKMRMRFTAGYTNSRGIAQVGA